MTEVWTEMCQMYKHLEDQNCLCVYANSMQNIWFEWYRKTFIEENTLNSEECQMLCISTIGLISEVYTDSIIHNQHVCSNVQQLFKLFSSNVWNTLVHHLKSSKNKYLVWTLIKSLTTMLYACGETDFSCHVNELLMNAKDNIFHEENINVLDFLSSIVEYKVKPENSDSGINICEHFTSSSISPFTDLFQSFCTILSQYWTTFKEQFYRTCSSSCQNSSIDRFLILWQKLIQKNSEEHPMFLNEKCVAAFFLNAHHLTGISLRVYVDIIMQFFVLGTKVTPSKEKDDCSLSNAISVALKDNFLDKLPCDIQITSFCVFKKSDKESVPSNILEDSSKCDSVIAKKISFICLNGLIGAKDESVLYDALQKVFSFMKDNFCVLPGTPLHSCILNIFMDHDDILLGMMLALLKLYNIFKQEKMSSETILLRHNQLESDLDPHLMFISFLKQIGFDHNELLSFLTSDETCFLVYLLQYTKLLPEERDNFVKAHKSLIKSDFGVSSHDLSEESIDLKPSSPTKPLLVGYSSNLFSSKDSSHHITQESVDNLNYSPPTKKVLVVYSSSSSSDEELVSSSSETCNDSSSVSFKNLAAIKTLVRLKEAILKLVHLKEFPYNASPLLTVLSACEVLR